MKNLPYYKGGTCEKHNYKLSFKGNLKELEFTDFEDFCNRADKILYTYTKYKKEVKGYKEYIYSKHYSNNPKVNEAIKDKCFEWVISNEYDDISINDLYSLLGMIKKGKK